MKQAQVREQANHSARSNGQPEVGTVAANPELARTGRRLTGELDKLLDEVDEVLEENAEEFVKAYVQRGGE